jgi:hypothetical protein
MGEAEREWARAKIREELQAAVRESDDVSQIF